MSTRLVLDAWAVLGWLQGEPTGAVVRDLVDWSEGSSSAGQRVRRAVRGRLTRPELFINIVNLGEVYYTLGRRRSEGEARATIEEIRASSITTLPAPDRLVLQAAALKVRYTMAYADAFAVATAMEHGARLVTGDPELRGVTEVPIVWIGRV